MQRYAPKKLERLDMKKHSKHLIALTLLIVLGFLAGSASAAAKEPNEPNLAAFQNAMQHPSLDAVAKVGQTVKDLLLLYGMQVIGAIAIYVIGKWLARIISKVVMRALTKAKVDPTLVPFIENLVYVAIMVFVVIAALAAFGVQTASIVAVLGAAGLAVGLALQGSLANFASGVLLLVFKPFKVGDFIEAGGTKGSVKAIHIFNTILTSPDNVRIIVPNGQITGGNISNYTANDTRRIDLVASVSYDDDLQKAKRVIESVLAAEPRILAEPAPQVAVSELADSSVDFIVRPWVKTSEYWAVRFDLTAKLKVAFDENGITVPFTSYELYVNNKKDGAK
jgi:small conductance mechanosensitive channel